MSQQLTTSSEQDRTDQQTTTQPNATDQPTQEELRERYAQQQRRLACPGCGEEPFLG